MIISTRFFISSFCFADDDTDDDDDKEEMECVGFKMDELLLLSPNVVVVVVVDTADTAGLNSGMINDTDFTDPIFVPAASFFVPAASFFKVELLL